MKAKICTALQILACQSGQERKLGFVTSLSKRESGFHEKPGASNPAVVLVWNGLIVFTASKRHETFACRKPLLLSNLCSWQTFASL